MTLRAAPDAQKAEAKPTQSAFKRLWRWQGTSAVACPPVWYKDRWIILEKQRTIVTLDKNGKKLWEMVCPDQNFEASPAAIDDKFFVLTKKGLFTARQIGDGALCWQTNLNESAYAHGPVTFIRGNKPAVAMVAQDTGCITCWDAATGTQLWQSLETQRTDGQLVADFGYAIYGNCDAAVYVWNSDNGNLLAKVPAGQNSQMAGTFALSSKLAFGGTRDGRMIAVDVKNHKIEWDKKITEGELFTTPLLHNTTLYMATDDGDLIAASSSSGETLWRKTPGSQVSSPCFVNNAIWLVADGLVIALDPASGETLFDFAAGDRISAPVAGDGQIAVIDDTGALLIFGKAQQLR